ncbi:Ribosomal protein S18 acetylase RimI [Asanoa hainanensis]|uniref:Ribosomal protein S18 acetylase RimI n=1 Tax=Asanoa hainanensis TaxID=560556 RepID=A0A239IDS9_9ACTN|nr:GNAT family N-acetyltransferase [Asanoa hainanensis]SNS90584.1 Ribosomal protein S18 acetylase RimI [Asanoa hainanensis]
MSAFAAYEPGRRTKGGEPVPVRRGTIADVPGCVELAAVVAGLDPVQWTRSLTASATDQERMLHVAEDAGRIVGYARSAEYAPPKDAPRNAAPAGWYLLGIVVDPAYRRRGIGRALTTARMTAIAERADAVWYFANARNRASLDLHTVLGFVEVTRDFWFPDLTFDGGAGVGVLCRAPLSPRKART